MLRRPPSVSPEPAAELDASTEVPTRPTAVLAESVDQEAAPVADVVEAVEAEVPEPVLVVNDLQPDAESRIRACGCRTRGRRAC